MRELKPDCMSRLNGLGHLKEEKRKVKEKTGKVPMNENVISTFLIIVTKGAPA